MFFFVNRLSCTPKSSSRTYSRYYDVVGDGKCKIVDTWWQTETGGVCMTPLPGDDDAKPGAAMRPFFGVEPVLVDNDGKVSVFTVCLVQCPLVCSCV